MTHAPLIRPSGTFSPHAGRRLSVHVRCECPSPRVRGEGGAERRVRGVA